MQNTNNLAGKRWKLLKQTLELSLIQENHLSPEQLLKLEKEKEELKIHRRSFPNDFISEDNIQKHFNHSNLSFSLISQDRRGVA